MEARNLSDAFADFQKRSATAYIEAWKAYFDFLGELAQLGRTKSPPAPPAPPPPAAAVRELVFEGAAGETPSRQFVVANRTDQPLDVAFEISEFASNDMRKIRADVEVLPATFPLQPGEEKVVECRVPVSEQFSEGEDYRAILRAAGLPEMEVILSLHRMSVETGSAAQAPINNPNIRSLG